MNILGTASRAGLVLLLAGSAAPALAGQTSSEPVDVYSNSSYTYASGSIADARSDVDPNTYIGCQLYANGGASGTTFGSCFAREPAATGGETAFCYPDGATLELLKTLNSDSYIFFQVPVDGSSCQGLFISNSSRYAPKQP